MPGSFELTPRQVEANRLLGSAATHILLRGGSRSGKTFLIVRAQVTRRLAHKSRGAILRHRFNHLKASIIYDTLPKVMELCFPGVAAHCTLDKTDWFYRFPNGSELWFGGLDDKERTEKILGQEHADLFLNECSQIPWGSRNMAVTRLAQRTPLRLKGYYDCNPPGGGHWTSQLFLLKRDPETRQPLAEPGRVAEMRINPQDNSANLPPDYIKELEALPPRLRQRFLLGEFQSDVDNALWTIEGIDKARVTTAPDMQRVIVAIDPSGCSGPEDTRSDEVGIVVAGLGTDGQAYVLEDLSGRFGPAGWGSIVATAYDRHDADCVVAETNYGGAMVEQVMRTARPRTPFKAVTASRGKAVRAEPISLLFDQGKAHLYGTFPELEDQLCSFTTAGYIGDKSPDRADAMVWALSEIFPAAARDKKRGEAVVQGSGGYSPFSGSYRQ